MNRIQLKIYHDQIGKILSGTLKTGDLVPGERELAAVYGTNVMNAKAAVNLLARRGLVRRKRHAGTRIGPAVDPELLNLLQGSGDKLAVLLTSPNPTGIHWDGETCISFRKHAAELGFSVIQLEFPVEREELKSYLSALAGLQPEAVAVLDDNFDHETLFQFRECFTRFPVPVARLNRLGASVPFNTPNTVSLDIDHYENGRRAGIAALSADLPTVILTLSSQIKQIKPNAHFFDKLEGIRDVFREAGQQSPRLMVLSEESLQELGDLIRNGKCRLVLALNLEIAVHGYDFLHRQNLKCPANYRILGIDDLAQYRSYQFSTVVIPKSVIGSVMADLACRRMPRLPHLHANLSVRIAGDLLRRKTF